MDNKNLEDIIWLFNCSKSSRGIIRLNLDEGAYLFKIAKTIKGKILEIGRFEGGSTLLLAFATTGEVESIDINPKNDEFVKVIMKNFGIKNIKLIINDVNKVELKKEYDMIFVDGDHTYEGIKRDYKHLFPALKIGGHLLFHDYSPSQPDVMKFLDELSENEKRIKEIKKVSSLAHYIKVL